MGKNYIIDAIMEKYNTSHKEAEKIYKRMNENEKRELVSWYESSEYCFA